MSDDLDYIIKFAEIAIKAATWFVSFRNGKNACGNKRPSNNKRK